MAKLGIFAVVLESLAKIGDVVTDDQEDPLAKVAKLAAEPIIVGAEQLIKTTGRSGGKSFTGYAKKSDLDELTLKKILYRRTLPDWKRRWFRQDCRNNFSVLLKSMKMKIT